MSNAAAVEALFFAALEKETEAERAAYLDSACEGDGELRSQVEKMLQVHPRVGDFLQKPAVEQLAAAPEPSGITQDLDASADRKVDNMTRTEGEGASDNEDSALEFLQPSTRPDSLGRIGHYEVLQVLGRGGFGIVFRAFDEMLQRVVALKVLAPQLAATSPARKRFLREARSSAQVRHENVVQVYEVAEQPLPYLAMEFIPGETLQQKLNRVGPLDVPETLRIGRQIAEGLAAAHATDLIHRDIKPGNVLIEGGQHKVKITDFGLARAADDASISQSGIIAGTPMYMAPEQALGETLDQRADLFSLGSVLYQMVAGRPPFRANSAVAVLKRVAEDRPRAIREIIPETPQWLCDIIAKLHAKNPADRYQTARDVADVLADCEAQLKAHSKLKDYSRIPRSQPQRSGRRKWGVAAAAVLLLPLIALLVTEFAGVTHLFRGWEATSIAKVDTPKKDEQPAKVNPIVPGEEDDADRRAAEYVLSVGGIVRVDANDGEIRAQAELPKKVFRLTRIGLNEQMPVTDSGLAACKGCKDVVALDLYGPPQITDTGLAAFKDCKKLEELALHGTSVTDAGLALFKDCKDLKNLDLWGCTQITDASCAPLKDYKKLTFLQLGDTRVTDAGLAHLKVCNNLAFLFLEGTQVTDAGLTDLVGLTELTYLKLTRTKVTVKRVAELAKALPKCKIEWDGGVIEPTASPDPDRRGAEYVLSVGGSVRIDGNERGIQARGDLPAGAFRLTFVDLYENKKVTDSGLAAFKDCKNLTGLELFACGQITGAGLAHFKDCKNLTYLSLEGVQVTDAALALFEGYKDLTYLQLGNTRITDAGLVHLKDCKKLTAIQFLNMPVTDAGLAHLKDCKQLTELDLRTHMTDAGLACFKDCNDLTTLWVWGTITNEGLAVFKHCKKLKDVDLSTTSVTDEGLTILKEWAKVETLRLNGTKVSDAGLDHVKHCKNLKYLEVRASKVSPAGIETVRKALPQCKIEWDGGVIEPTASPDPDRRAAEYVLSIGGTVRVDGTDINNGNTYFYTPPSIGGDVRINGNERVIRAQGELPKGVFRLTSVDLDRNKQVTDSGLAAFQGCKNVRVLALYGCTQITDAGLAHFKDCKDLQALELEGVRITDAGLALFAGCKDLAALGLNNTLVTDTGLVHLKDCKKLTTIGFLNTPMTDAGLAHLKGCKDLTRLDLRNTKVTDAALAYFKDCENLTDVNLSDTSITNAGLGVLKEWKKMEDLSLTNTSITDAALILVKECKELRILRLEGTGASDAGLVEVAECKNLTYLGAKNTKVSAAGIERLRKALPQCKIEWDGGVIEPTVSPDPDRRAAEYVLSIGGTVCVDGNDRGLRAKGDLPAGAFQLTYVGLGQNKQVTDAGLAVFKDCKNVTTLDLYGCGQITDAGIAHFKDCKNLSILQLEAVQVTDTALAFFAGYKDLTYLQLNHTQVTDAGLVHLKDCKKLTAIGFLNRPVTDAGLVHLKDCKDLTSLDLRGTKVTDVGLAYFKDCKNLSALWLDGTPITDAGLAYFKDCKNLTELRLGGTPITDAGLALFDDCKDLTSLDLAGTSITDEGLAHLKGHKKLAGLTLGGTKVSEQGLAHLKGMSLKALQIDDTGITDLTLLQGMPLEDIRLTPKNITKGLDILKGMKSLKTIGIAWYQGWPAAEFWERHGKGEFKE